MELKRIDHIGIVVQSLEDQAAQLEALGLHLGRTNENDESYALYYPCGDASVELIDVRDAEARERRGRVHRRHLPDEFGLESRLGRARRLQVEAVQ